MSKNFAEVLKAAGGKLGGIDKQLDINELITNETSGLVNFQVWEETVAIQKQFNTGVVPDWMQDKKQEKYDFWMAIMDETVEVLGSRHWKWWKDSSKLNTIDWDNVRVEMIDIFHFLLSIAIQNNSTELFFAALLATEQEKKTDIQTTDQATQNKFFNDFWTRFLISTQMKALPMCIIQWVEFWNRLGLASDELFKDYRIKAALNIIRQEFGYGVKNSYKKMWPDPDGNKLVEDNVVAWKLAQNINEVDINTLEEFTTKLRKYYLKNLSI